MYFIVDTALQARQEAGNPVRVGMIGSGFMGKGIANQIVNSVPGMELVAIFNRTVEKAKYAYQQAGVEDIREVKTVAELEDAIAHNQYAVTDDAMLLCRAEGIDALIEVTGAIEFGAHVVMEAIAHKKHIILMNAELDGTIGPILKTYADKAGVIITACEGDQPGVEMNLYRYVKSLGLTPMVCGNIKGLHDAYRNPTTQKGFAEQWGQNVHMVTSFADGTKISFEQAIVANGTGMTIAKRGMMGHDFMRHKEELIKEYNLNFNGHIDDLTKLYDIDQLKELGGIVDYVVAVKPGPGVYVFATHDDPKQRHYLNLYKLGEGPLYSFYHPYHLCHLEVPMSVARVVLFNDVVLAPTYGPRVDVITAAKTDLKAGETIDELGGYMTYGLCETAQITLEQNLLPIGLAEGCVLKRDVAKDQVLTYDDVELPAGRLCDKLRAEQNAMFFPSRTLVTA
ncbi:MULTISPECIES: Gfo/Idh/MocA family oxidoreductase [unclassified Leptolyngbya]|uniref:NAD(P)H-dependent oxidoreductase n=1 Tax=unclassified Leptolyngbya TaxID=2650499 RepID=UPI0016861C2A|nr:MULTISPECIES: Gfo/Idh/MocA family oxidoreductase [unclassified Leptolyngbya]MBD1913409.1 Gfo/Idh/MocA family oxidoreductase [Leptolyngbya sp. FACHB-8]MBD2156833.1 Gfo/Idh/MocA family oxidoreductase [Leptolyngbya sp. FACHB-16]